MKYATVAAIANGYDIDFDAPGAAMRLAWKWTAQELWAARKFGTDHRDMFARLLRQAWVHVKMLRENRRRARAAVNDARIADLKQQKVLLQNRPFGMSIQADVARIDAEIAHIIDKL